MSTGLKPSRVVANSRRYRVVFHVVVVQGLDEDHGLATDMLGADIRLVRIVEPHKLAVYGFRILQLEPDTNLGCLHNQLKRVVVSSPSRPQTKQVTDCIRNDGRMRNNQ